MVCAGIVHFLPLHFSKNYYHHTEKPCSAYSRSYSTKETQFFMHDYGIGCSNDIKLTNFGKNKYHKTSRA